MLKSVEGAYGSATHYICITPGVGGRLCSIFDCSTCPLQATATRRTAKVQTHTSIVCQAIAEPQAKPVGEQEMRIANDVSQLIGKTYR